MKYDDDKDALAAEYVLGTLSSDERDQAEAMLSIDPGFEAAVRQWERRLGELNVMVEAVEPRPQVWDRIKVGLGHEDAGREHAELALPRIENVAPHVPDDLHEPEGLEQPEEDHAPEPALTLDVSDQPEPEAEAETAETGRRNRRRAAGSRRIWPRWKRACFSLKPDRAPTPPRRCGWSRARAHAAPISSFWRTGPRTGGA